MNNSISLTDKEAKALRKVLKANKNKPFRITRHHDTGIGPVTLVDFDNDSYNITDYSVW